jgi:Protein of unknown function (DUF3142)
MNLVKRMSTRSWSIVAVIFVLIGLGLISRQAISDVDRKLPPIILWAWERPEKLDFIDTYKVAVAFLAKTISLRGDETSVRPRMVPLSVPPDTKMIAVARIESDRLSPPALSNNQLEKIVEELSELSRLRNVVAVQIDFDATRSQRDFYRNAIVKLRQRLPAAKGLSITALASWCKGDDWLTDLPIDEAVPMLFRMGIDRQSILSQLQSGATFTGKPCKGSAGVSIDEPLTSGFQGKHLYIFNPQSWSPASFKTAMEIYTR